MIEMFNIDCMDYMRKLPCNSFDLAIVDPPYGLQASGNLSRMNGGGKLKNRAINQYSCDFDLEMPSKDYWDELSRVSRNQIVWGGNYFDLPPTRGIICWDKEQAWPNFSSWEMAWTSFDSPAKLFRMSSLSKFAKDGRSIHPTQKPVALYEWILSNYAKKGQRIIDTHGGSGSICIACHNLGFDLVWLERDMSYYESAKNRFSEHSKQGIMFA